MKDDILISSEWDNDRNQKVIFIYGDEDKDGDIDIVSSNKENDYYHVDYFYVHGKKNYLDNNLYQKLLENAYHSKSYGSLLIFHGYLSNNIVITTSLDFIGLFLPKDIITEKQKCSLIGLLDKFNKNTDMLICADPFLNDGVPMNRTTISKVKIDIDDILNDIDDIYKEKKVGKVK